MDMNGYTLRQRSDISSARTGVLKTPHGEIETPFFMPIATKGSVKTLSSADVERLGGRIILSNTYHLYLRPGVDVLASFGGLHRFMSWPGIMLTDSGGYQVFSLSRFRKITEEGAAFASHIDGSRHLLTPEKSIAIQQIIGSDIAMVLDECPPHDLPEAAMEASVARTTRWAARSKDAFLNGAAASNNPDAQLFGIVQGGTDERMRTAHARDLVSIGFDGYAVGGLSVGEPFEDACRVISAVDRVLPHDTPRYFMGGAQPHEIVAYVKRGIDMFDCVLPTRNARHGLLYRFTHGDVTKPDFYETVHITNEKWKNDPSPLIPPRGSTSRFNLEVEPPDAVDSELSRFSYAYLRHLFMAGEPLGPRLATLVNVRFYLELMARIRAAIQENRM